MVTDSVDGHIIKGTRVRSKAVNLVVALDSHIGVTIWQGEELFVAPVQVRCPHSVCIDFGSCNILLESNNVASWDDFWLQGCIVHWCPQNCWEQSSSEEEGAFEELHGVGNIEGCGCN